MEPGVEASVPVAAEGTEVGVAAEAGAWAGISGFDSIEFVATWAWMEKRGLAAMPAVNKIGKKRFRLGMGPKVNNFLRF